MENLVILSLLMRRTKSLKDQKSKSTKSLKVPKVNESAASGNASFLKNSGF